MDKTETNDLLEECMLYFKARPVYKKLFLKMRDKYAGLGHFGGTAMLTSLSREEKSQLGGFFQRDYTSNKTITISADLMKKCLESSKFAGLTWELILETYFGEPSLVKYQFIIDVLGISEFPTTGENKYEAGELYYFQDELRVALVKYNNEHKDKPLTDENGNKVSF